MSQNDLLSSHITVSSTLLCPALYCVQLITVSSTLLCPTKYCVHTYPKGLLFPFTFQCAAVLSGCACKPKFLIKKATKNNTSFEDNASQNDHLYCHIMVCSALYCVQHFTVSRTLLCPTHYCVKQNSVSTLTQKIFCSPFTFQRAAVVLCACKAPLLYKRGQRVKKV